MADETLTMDDFSKAVDDSFTSFKDEGEANWEKLKEYQAAKTPMTVTVDGNEPTTHETTSNYTDGNSFALISGKAEETTPDDPVTPTVPDDPDTPTDPDDPEVPDVPNTRDDILTSITILAVSLLGLAATVALFKKDKKNIKA